MANGPPAGICELMRALQNVDNVVRKDAEQKLMEAVKGAETGGEGQLLPVRNNAGHVVCAVANTVAKEYSELLKEWPRLLHFLSETISAGEAQQVTACIKVLCNLVDLVGEELLKQGPQTAARRRWLGRKGSV
eukprot:g32298.t1